MWFGGVGGIERAFVVEGRPEFEVSAGWLGD